MITERRIRAPRPESAIIPPTISDDLTKPKPIERQVRTDIIKVFLEKCPACGVSVEFKTLRTSGNRKDVWCPKCGRRHVINVATDTIRPINESLR